MSTAPSIGFDTLIQPLNEAGFPAAHFPPSSEQPFDFYVSCWIPKPMNPVAS